MGQNGQISLTLPKVDIPAVSDYYVVDSTKTQADAISKTFAFTKDGTLTFENTVKYAPVKQELQIKVYDDESNTPGQALDTTDSGATTNFTGNSKSDFPADVATNLEALKAYYENKNYVVETLPAATGKFDSTNNGSGADKQVQVLEVRLKHAKDVKKETKTVTRTINYYDQDQNKLIGDANRKVTEAQTIEQKVDFERYTVRDQITKQIIGYATPDQVTTTGDQTTLKQADGYTHTTGQASDATAGFVITSDSKTLPSKVNYDLSKYGYEAPTTADGASFAQVDEVTPKPTDDDTVVNVYYHEKVVTVTVDNPPVEGQTVPGTDAKFPANDWSAQRATNTSTRTIHYVYDKNTFVNGKDVSGQPVPGLKDIEQTVVFTQSAKINLVTGDVIYQGDWKIGRAHV